MACEEPFILSKRKDSPYYQVRFKNPDKNSTNRFLPAKSTKETVKSKAIAKAWSMYNQDKIETKSTVQRITLEDITEKDAAKVLESLKEKGFITNYSVPDKDSPCAVDFLTSFWSDKSPYIAEKKRMGKHLGVIYIEESHYVIKTYWASYFDKELLLNQLTRKMLKDFIAHIDTLPLSWSRKLKIYRAGAIAIRWAYNEEMIDRDITAGLSSFSGKSKERKILTKELAELLFSTDWEDERCKMINLIAMLTGMRAGEILALRKMDLGENCLYVNHSWNRKEGLKSPKNGDSRVVYFPFPNIIHLLLDNNAQMEDFLFPAPLADNKPMDVKLPNKMLKRQLVKIGLSESEAKTYCFHAWRHFYTTYMSEKVNDRILQKQTGHKSLRMLEHYGNHSVNEDMEVIRNAQMESFGSIISALGYEGSR